MRAREMGECVGRVWRVLMMMLMLMLMLCVHVSVGSGGCMIAPNETTGHVDIPSTWTSIPYNAFLGCTTLKTVTIPETITSIGNSSFSYSGLTTITIPDSVTEMGVSVFSGCSELQHVSLGSGLVHIPGSAFSFCTALKTVTIPETITSIGSMSFSYSNLTSVTIPDSVTEMGVSVFSGCSELQHVSLGSGLVHIPGGAFYACTALKTVTIPETITSIGNTLFSYSGLTTITIPDSVTEMGVSVFSGCSELQHVSLGSGLVHIPGKAFYDCTALETVTIPETITSIGSMSFTKSGLTSVTIPDSVSVIPEKAFFRCKKLITVTLGKNVQELRDSSFARDEAMESMNLPEGLMVIGYAALSNRFSTSWDSVTFPRSLKLLDRGACGGSVFLKYATFNSEVLVMGKQPFVACIALKAENVLYNKNISISVPASQVNSTVDWGDAIAVQCTRDGGCVCKGGYGNGVKGSKAADYFSCKPCDAGSSSTDPLSQGKCELCAMGTYAEEAKTQKCTKCAVGKYGITLGARSESIACRNCPAGNYSSSAGQTECGRCPPGNSCPDSGMEKYTLCPPGRYQDEWGQESCKDCEAGKYQVREGQAVCVECEAGKHNPNENSTSASACVGCAAGKYASQSGTSDCTKCDKDSFTDSSSMSVCTACPDGWTTTGVTDDGTGASYCVVDERPCEAGKMKSATTGACEECVAGRYSSDGKECKECGAGWYSRIGSSECSLCAAGRYGDVTGAANCTECADGKYVRVAGATKCTACPPGSYCPSAGMNMFNRCPPGNFTDTSNRVSCTACPAGRYQDSEGAAKCVLCPAGTATALSESANATSCVACGAGRYAGQNGTAECMSCAVGQFQAESGQAECQVCEEYYDDATLTSNADHTGCEINAALAQSRLVEAMFEDGLAVVITCTCLAVFAAVGGLVTSMRAKEPERLANFALADAAYYSLFPGFSFVADVVLMVGVWATSPGLGATMLLARLLHVAGGIALSVCLFGPVESVRGASAYLDYFVRDAHVQREYLDGEFVREHVYMVQSVVLLSLCDVTMLHFLPWKKSRFFVVSEGYPSQSLMQTSLLVKTVQSSMNVACEISYLMYSNDAANPMSSPAAQALFYMNIIFGVITVVMDLLMLCMRGEILRSVETEERLESLRRQHGKGEKSDKSGGTVSARGASADGESGVDKGMVYYNEGETSVTTANPMLTSAASGALVCTTRPALGAVSVGAEGLEGVGAAAAAAALSDADKEREEIARALAAIEADL